MPAGNWAKLLAQASLATANLNVPVTHPTCASDCMQRLSSYNDVGDKDSICSDRHTQMNVFRCLSHTCDGISYGPAMAEFITICSSLGANISILHPVQINHVDHIRRELLQTGHGPVVAFSVTDTGGHASSRDNEHFDLAFDCQASPTGPVTLPVATPSVAATVAPCPGATPKVPGNNSGAIDTNGNDSPSGNSGQHSSSQAGSSCPDTDGCASGASDSGCNSDNSGSQQPSNGASSSQNDPAADARQDVASGGNYGGTGQTSGRNGAGLDCDCDNGSNGPRPDGSTNARPGSNNDSNHENNSDGSTGGPCPGDDGLLTSVPLPGPTQVAQGSQADNGSESCDGAGVPSDPSGNVPNGPGNGSSGEDSREACDDGANSGGNGQQPYPSNGSQPPSGLNDASNCDAAGSSSSLGDGREPMDSGASPSSMPDCGDSGSPTNNNDKGAQSPPGSPLSSPYPGNPAACQSGCPADGDGSSGRLNPNASPMPDSRNPDSGGIPGIPCDGDNAAAGSNAGAGAVALPSVVTLWPRPSESVPSGLSGPSGSPSGPENGAGSPECPTPGASNDADSPLMGNPTVPGAYVPMATGLFALGSSKDPQQSTERDAQSGSLDSENASLSEGKTNSLAEESADMTPLMMTAGSRKTDVPLACLKMIFVLATVHFMALNVIY